jgi:hypothetical protein
MKKLYCLILLSFLNFPIASQQRIDISGEMNCTVTGNVVITSEEGKFKQYAGYQDGIRSGDNLKFLYKFADHGVFLRLFKSDIKNTGILSEYIRLKDEKNIERIKNGLIFSGDGNSKISFLEDYIRISNIFGDFYLSRYYKNDWHGIFVYVKSSELSSHTMTVNCRHTNDRMESIFKAY